jgi:hypothetical protein
MNATLDILGATRLTGGIFLDAEFTAPWCVTAGIGPDDCAPFTPPPSSIIAYHYVSAGQLLLKVGNEPPVAARGGDLVVLPATTPISWAVPSISTRSVPNGSFSPPHRAWLASSTEEAANERTCSAVFWAATRPMTLC